MHDHGRCSFPIIRFELTDLDIEILQKYKYKLVKNYQMAVENMCGLFGAARRDLVFHGKRPGASNIFGMKDEKIGKLAARKNNMICNR